MYRIKFLLLGILLTLPMIGNGAFAMDILTGDNVVISDTVIDDLYLFSGNVSINADVIGDLYVVGGSVTVNGNVSEDLVILGGKVIVLGNVEDDVRILGGQASVYGNVGDDLMMAGGQLDIGPKAFVNGSLYASGGMVSIDGIVNEDLEGTFSVMLLNGTINRNANVTVENMMSFSDKASINGNLTYRKLLEENIPKGVVKGKIDYKEFSTSTDIKDDESNLGIFYLLYKSFSLFNALVLALLFVILSPKFLAKSAEVTKTNLLKTFAVGLLTFILIIVGLIILLMTLFGIQLAIIIGFIFGAILYLSKIFVAAWLSSYIVDFKSKKYLKVKLFFAMTLSLIIYYLVGIVPIVGWFVNMILFMIGLGSIVLTKQYYVLYLRNKNQI